MEELNVKQLILAIRSIAQEKNLSEEAVIAIIEQAIAAAWRRDNGTRDQEVRSELNINDGTAKAFVSRYVVEEVHSKVTEISLEDAKKIKSDAVLGDKIEQSYPVESFGRVAAQTAKQVVLQRLREAERENVLEEYKDKVGTVVTGIVQRLEARVVRIDLGRTTGIIPPNEQIHGEYYPIGARIKVYIKEIEYGSHGPQLILSRANAEFISYLFKQEVPEVENGTVEIKAIAREAGKRTKIAVSSSVPGVDAVGTFVGGHGTRVQAVMNEIGEQERIDIVDYSDDPEAFIKNALSPAVVTKIDLNTDDKTAKVYVESDQQSIAIGRSGQNVRLASRLTGYSIDIEPIAKEPVAKKEPVKKTKRKNVEDSLIDALNAETDDEKDMDDDSSDNVETEESTEK